MSHPVMGLREHLAAVDAIAKAGGDPTDHDLYLETVESAVRASAADDYLERAGAFPEASADLVTREMLIERANMILVEKGNGFTEVLPNGLIDGVPPAEIEAAFRQAVEELGQIGDRRRDAEQQMQARRDRIVDEAVRARKIPNAQASVWLAQLERDPENVAAVLAKLPVDPHLDSLAALEGDRVILVDDESLVIANRADDLVVARGQATRDPHSGQLVGCSHTDYTRALLDVEKAMKAEAEKAAQAA